MSSDLERQATATGEQTGDESTRVARESARTRIVILVTGVLTVLVMGAVIALGLEGGKDQRSRGPGGQAPYDLSDLYRRHDGKDATPIDDGCPFDPEHPPRLRFDLPPTGLEFGQVKQGVKMEREVAFRNEGTGPLCIRRVEAGCGCMKAKLVDDKRRYEPGESGRIQVALDTKSKEGILKKTVTVYTNAVDVPLHKFVARASVTLGMRLSHAFVNFGRVTAGQPAEQRVRLRTPKDDDQWEITEVVGTTPIGEKLVEYDWRVENVQAPKDLVRELVIVHPGLAKEDTSHQDKIVVRTTHPDRPEFTLRAHLYVVKPILAVPRRAVLGFVPSNLPPPRVKLVPGDPTVKFQVKGIRFVMTDGSEPPPDGTGFKAVQGKDPGGEPWVEVSYDGRERRAGPIRATLVVSTDLDRMPELRIDCYATVQ